MAYPTGIKIFIDDEDCTYYVFGSPVFNPSSTSNTFRELDITPYLRRAISHQKMVDRNYKGNSSVEDIHTIEITATDGNGRVECRVEVR